MGGKPAKKEAVIICMYSNHTAVSDLFPGLLGGAGYLAVHLGYR